MKQESYFEKLDKYMQKELDSITLEDCDEIYKTFGCNVTVKNNEVYLGIENRINLNLLKDFTYEKQMTLDDILVY